MTADGSNLLVAAITVRHVEDNLMVFKGLGKASDNPGRADHARYMHDSCAFWLYRLLVIRQAFTEWDPIRSADSGHRIAYYR